MRDATYKSFTCKCFLPSSKLRYTSIIFSIGLIIHRRPYKLYKQLNAAHDDNKQTYKYDDNVESA